MKKITIPILAITFLILSGCYKGDDTVTVKISLQNFHAAKSAAPVSFLAKVRSFFIKNAFAANPPDIFIAAEKGSDILATLSVNSGEITDNTVEFEVPAGNDITILVVNTSDGIAVNYDYEKINLEAGKTENVTLTLSSLTWCDDTGCANIIDSLTPSVTWTEPGVFVKYYIEDSDGATLFEGYENHAIINNYSNYLIIEFIPFNIKTTKFLFDVNSIGK